MRRRHRGGRLCKGRARQGGVSSTSDGWRRQQREVRDATCTAPSLPSPVPRPPGTARRGPVPPLLRSGDPPRRCAPRWLPCEHSSRAGAAGPCLFRAPGGRRRPNSCSRAHFADGETDAGALKCLAPGPRGFEPRCVKIGSPSFSSSYWKFLSSEEGRGVKGEGFPCSENLDRTLLVTRWGILGST